MAKTPSKLRILELYSGIGGMHAAAIESGVVHKIVGSYEINTTALQVYNHNFTQSQTKGRNLMSLTVEQLNDMEPDIIMMSPPCQPFTRTGLKKDVEDNRTSSFLHTLKLLEEVTSLPGMILLENVKGFEVSQARDRMIQVLEKRNYKWKEYLLSPNQLMIPNSRLRYYLLAKLNPNSPNNFWNYSGIDEEIPFCTCRKDFETVSSEGNKKFKIDLPDICDNCGKNTRNYLYSIISKHSANLNISSTSISGEPLRLTKYITSDIDITPYLLSSKILSKYATILDIVSKTDNHSCCFTKGYGDYILGTGSVILHNSEASVSQAFSEENNLTDDEKLEKLLELKLRFFSPNEILKLMCFPEWFTLPPSITTKQCYSALGNSVNVLLVTILLQILLNE